ncbi:MAG: ATP-binding protein [Limnoraphis sp.]
MFTPQIQSLKTLIRQTFSQVSLRTLLTIPFLVQMLGIVGLTGYLSWKNGEKAVDQLVMQLQYEVSNRIEQKLYSFLETPKLVTEINQKSVETGELDLQNTLELQRHLWQHIQIFDQINFIQFGTSQGNYIGISSHQEPILRIDLKNETTNELILTYQLDNQGNREKRLQSSNIPYDPRIRPWYKAAIQANQPTWVDLYNWFDNAGVSLTFVRPIRNNQNQIISVTGADISFQEFNKFLRKQKIGQSGQIFIIDRQGFLIASSTLETVFKIQDNQAIQIKAVNSGDPLITATVEHLFKKFDDLNRIKKLEDIQFINKGKEEFLQVLPFKDEFGLDWLIVVVVPEADFMEQIYANTRTTISLCLGALAIVIIIGIITSNQLTHPIVQLSKAAKALSSGDWNQTLKNNPIKEFNVLANAFNQMSQKLQNSYQQLEQYSQGLEQKVTERTQELQQSQQKFSIAFQNTPNPIIINRMSDHSYFDVNESFCQLTGYTHEEILGKTSLDLNLWVNLKDYEQFYQTLITEGKLRNYEFNYRTKSGKIRTALLSADLIEINSEQYLLSSSNDITDRKQVENQLQTQNIELEIARKNADAANQAKSTFLANMSHELRTPLNAILGFSQLMAQNPIFVSASKELEIINRSGEHLLSLINDILDLSKIEVGKVVLEEKPFDFYILLDTLEEMLKMRANAKGIQLISERDQIPQYIKTDENKLRQVLINLIGNAIKFTNQGSITLRVDSHSPDVNSLTPNSPVQLFFEVEDTGAGISTEEIDQLFDAFVQTSAGKQSQQGTGLGLSISRKFVQLMGGKISVKSQLGKGSLFQFNIQATTVKADEVISPKPQKKVISLAPNQPQYRILVVDEIPENRLLVSQLLTPLGFVIFEAENGLEAIKQWENHSPDLIWMDIRMPVMDGYQATQQIKAKPAGKNTIIIALTASALSQDEQAILDAGCDDILHKPFQAIELLEKIATHLGVRYIYETPNILSQSSVSASELTPETLSIMPLEWLEKFHQAAIRGDDAWMNDLITQIPESQAELAATLTSIIEDFRFDKITAITEQLV